MFGTIRASDRGVGPVEKKGVTPLRRKLRIVNPGDPLFCVCEACSGSFKSTSPESEQAEQEVKAQFDAHECKTESKSPNESRKE